MSDHTDEPDPQHEPSPEGGRRRESRVRGFARRILREVDDEGEREGPRMDAREFLGAMLETGDKAKTEIVRMVAREARSYLDALELQRDLRHLLTHYSLEVHASLSLKALDDTSSASHTRVGLKRKADAPERDEPEPDQEQDAQAQGEPTD